MSRQALELALEALERCVATCFDQRSHDQVMGRPEHFVNQTITAIKEALAQPEQEPVGKFAKFTDGIWREVTDGSAGIPLYTTPPQREWVGLTDEEILEAWHWGGAGIEGAHFKVLYSYFEQKLRKKNEN